MYYSPKANFGAFSALVHMRPKVASYARFASKNFQFAIEDRHLRPIGLKFMIAIEDRKMAVYGRICTILRLKIAN